MSLKLTQPSAPRPSAMLKQCFDTASILQGRTLEVLGHVKPELRTRLQEIHRKSNALAREIHAALEDCPDVDSQHPVNGDGEPCLTTALDLLDEVEYQLKRAQQGMSAEHQDADAAYLQKIIDARLSSLRIDIEEVQK